MKNKSFMVNVHITDKINLLFNDGMNHVEFYSDNNYFKVIIFNANYNAEKSKEYSVNESVNEREEKLLSIIADNLDIKRSKIVELSGLSRATVDRTLKALKEKGIIERIGSDKSGKWKLNK